MKRYEKYKPSGVEWIGEVPEHWEQCRLKNYCSLKGRIGWNGLRSDEFKTESYAYLVTGQDFEGAVIPWGNCYQIERERYEEDPFIQLKNGDILITKDGTIGKIAKVTNLDKPACLNSGIFVLKQKKAVFDQDYLYWVLVSNMLTDFNNYTSSGTTILHLYQNVFENMPLLVPTFAEQEAIAAYLDARCADIDKVVATQQKRIALLQELKQSEITQAVTHGLNPDARMKDSGVEWIGLVPEHWNIRKIKFTTTIVRGGSPRPIDKYLTTDDEGYNWIKIGDAIKGCKYITSTQQKIKPEGFSATRMVHENDLILSNSMSFGQPYIMKIDGCIHDGWLAFSNYNGIVMDYLYYTLQSHFCATQFGMSVDGGVVKNLNIEKVGDTFISLPPIEEQSEIAEYLDRRCGEIDKQIGAVTKQIELLMEYKQALITEVVTGKRRV